MSNPFVHEIRGSMTPQRRAKIFADKGGRCYICTRKLGPADDWHVEHVHALECGGTDEDVNLEVVCEWCHKPKTADDHKEAGHMRRAYTNHVVPKRHRKRGRW